MGSCFSSHTTYSALPLTANVIALDGSLTGYSVPITVSEVLVAYSALPPTAKVIALDGSLTGYSVPITVSDVLGVDHITCFLCNSDDLFFDTCIPPMDAGDTLVPDQIYFVLPKAKLKCTLTGTDMAALAVKASQALALASEKHGCRRQTIGFTPLAGGGGEYGGFEGSGTFDEGNTGIPVRPRSVQKKVGRSASAWAGVVRRSFKRSTLSTIEEETELMISKGKSEL